MVEYPKIPTVWKRDPGTNHKTLIENAWATPEIEWLKDADWVWTEKVDGTNIRLMWNAGETHPDESAASIAGRTDRADIPAGIMAWFDDFKDALCDWCETLVGVKQVCLYGEGYGAYIQKGHLYRRDQSFILFDVRINEHWSNFDAVCSIARQLNIDHVPIVETGPLIYAIERTTSVMPSKLKGAARDGEGLVMRPMFEIQNRAGNRIVTKVKRKDFR